MQLVFDGPMRAIEGEQVLGRSFGNRQAGDEIDRFGAGLAAYFTCSCQPGDLGKAGPIKMGYGFGTDLDLARLKSAVIFIERLCCFDVGRRTIVDPAWV
jgi:hypothetical protein